MGRNFPAGGRGPDCLGSYVTVAPKMERRKAMARTRAGVASGARGGQVAEGRGRSLWSPGKSAARRTLGGGWRPFDAPARCRRLRTGHIWRLLL